MQAKAQRAVLRARKEHLPPVWVHVAVSQLAAVQGLPVLPARLRQRHSQAWLSLLLNDRIFHDLLPGFLYLYA